LVDPASARNINVDLESVPSAPQAKYVSFRVTFQSYLKNFFARRKILRALPMWAKIAIVATLCAIAAAAIIGLSVYFTQAGQ
jgi:hypothetical protein